MKSTAGSRHSFPEHSLSLSRSDISKSNRRDMQLRSAEIAPEGESKGEQEQNTDPGTQRASAPRLHTTREYLHVGSSHSFA